MSDHLRCFRQNWIASGSFSKDGTWGPLLAVGQSCLLLLRIVPAGEPVLSFSLSLSLSLSFFRGILFAATLVVHISVQRRERFVGNFFSLQLT